MVWFSSCFCFLSTCFYVNALKNVFLHDVLIKSNQNQWNALCEHNFLSLCLPSNESRIKEVVLENKKVTVLKKNQIFGLIFDSKLNWYSQTKCTIEKANIEKQALHILSKYFSTDEMLKLATS